MLLLLLRSLLLLVMLPDAPVWAGNSTTSVNLPVAHMAFFTAVFPTTPVPVSLFVPNTIATQSQESFLMSLADVKANPSILPGTDLKFLVLPVPPSGMTATALAVANMTRHAFNGQGVDMSVGAKFDYSSEAIAPVLQDADVIQVGYNPGSLMSHNELYSTFLRIVPPGAYDGKFIAQNIQQQFGWSRIALFTVSDDVDSLDCMTEFTEEAALRGLNILSTALYPMNTPDLTSRLVHAALTEPRVIILIMPPQNTVMFLQQAFKNGLLMEGVTVIGTSYSAPTTMTSFFNETDDIGSMMKGFLVFQANLNWTTSVSGKAFVKRYQSWPASISYSNNMTFCSNETDDEGYFTIYEQHLIFNASLPYICGGIIPSSYTSATISVSTAYVYDALQALARGLDIMVRNATSPITKISGRALKRIIVDHVRFEGVTGTVSFSSGRTSSSNYGYGDRIDRVPYLLSNFNNASFAKTGNPFRTIGYYDADMVYTACDPALDASCSKPIYNTIDNSIPSDSPAPIHMNVPVGVSSAIIALASIFMLITAVCMVFVAYHRNDSAFKALQPYLLLGTLTGCLMCCAEMIVEALSVDETTCSARVWLVHLSFFLILGSILAKIYRIHLIINASGLKKVVVSEMFALYTFLAGLSFFLVYLIILTTVGNPSPTESFTVSPIGLRTYESYCKMTQPGVEYFLFALELLMIVAAIGINVAVSNAPKKIHVSAVELRAIMGVTAFYVAIVIRDADIVTDHSILRAVIAFLFLLAVLLVLIAKIPLLLPKAFGALKINGGRFGESRRNGGSTSRKKDSGVISFHVKPEEVLGNIMSKYNSLTKEMQVTMCIKHIELWKQLMIDAEIPFRIAVDDDKKAAGPGGAYLASARGPLASLSKGASNRPILPLSNSASNSVLNANVSNPALKVE